MNNMLKKYPIILLAVLAAFIGIWFFIMRDGIRMITSDGYIIDCALNIMNHGKIALSINGDMYKFDKYWLEYPPLLSILIAGAFKLFGASYFVSKFFSLISMSFALIALYMFSSRYAKPAIAGLVTALVAFDPLFLNCSIRVRPDAVTVLLFTVSIAVFFVNLDRRKLSLAAVSGATAGLAFLTHFNMIWIMLVFAAFVIISPRDFKKMFKVYLVHGLAFLIVIAPYVLWIILDQERLGLFMKQVFLNTYLAKHPSMHFTYIKMLLNPLANFYLMFFQARSFYPFIFAASALYFLLNFRTHKYLFLAIAVPFLMTMLNFRASHYLLPTIAICYGGLSFYFPKDVPLTPRRFKRSAAIFLTFLVMLELLIAADDIRKSPAMLMDRGYFTKVFEENTVPGSRIATEVNFILCEPKDRKIVNVSSLIYDVWRIYYSYDDIVEAINPDYIVMTEYKKGWAEMDHPQSKDFQKLLNEKFEFVKVIRDPHHTSLWIYKRKSGGL